MSPTSPCPGKASFPGGSAEIQPRRVPELPGHGIVATMITKARSTSVASDLTRSVVLSKVSSQTLFGDWENGFKDSTRCAQDCFTCGVAHCSIHI